VDSRRAESFSDGVFAVAITLLVLNLLPVAGPSVTAHALVEGWPKYVAYVVSFLTIGIMWLNHHTLLSHATSVDRTVLVLNLFLLMGVVAVPFTTALVAENLRPHTPAASAQIAAVVYGLVMIVNSVCFSAIWLYLARPARPPLATTVRFSGGLIAYLVATLVAIVSAPPALIIYALIAIYYVFEHLPSADSGTHSTD
jgi:uncharacterized membrane protein